MKKLMIFCTLIILIAGCAANKRNDLIIVTATNIGLKVGVSELDRTPELKLNFYRLEGAAVPTSINKETGKMETANTIAKFRYHTSFKNGNGIESMIATGESALWKPSEN